MARRRLGRDAGTASMEMLLVVPLLTLILVLLVDMGYGWFVRARSATAARFAGTTFIRGEPYNLGYPMADLALQTYYDDLVIRDPLRIEEQPRTGSLFDDGAWIGLDWVDSLGSWIGGRGYQQHVTLVVEREPPIGTLVGDQPLSVHFAIDGEAWTYDKIPLSIPGMVDAMVDFGDVERWGDGIFITAFRMLAFIIGYMALGFFWVLGMYP